MKAATKEDPSLFYLQLRSYIINAAISGGVCAVVSASLNGIDVTKIRLQNQDTGFANIVVGSMDSKSNIRYSGMISSMKRIFREEGWRGLMQGSYWGVYYYHLDYRNMILVLGDCNVSISWLLCSINIISCN